MTYSYWYFTYVISNKFTLAHIRDDGVIMSIGDFFPIGAVTDMCKEAFGEGFKFTLLNAMRISEEDFQKFNTEEGGWTE